MSQQAAGVPIGLLRSALHPQHHLLPRRGGCPCPCLPACQATLPLRQRPPAGCVPCCCRLACSPRATSAAGAPSGRRGAVQGGSGGAAAVHPEQPGPADPLAAHGPGATHAHRVHAWMPQQQQRPPGLAACIGSELLLICWSRAPPLGAAEPQVTTPANATAPALAAAPAVCRLPGPGRGAAGPSSSSGGGRRAGQGPASPGTR